MASKYLFKTFFYDKKIKKGQAETGVAVIEALRNK